MRVDNWEIRLIEFAYTVQHEPFVWGETDCASIVRRGVEIMLEKSPITNKLVPKWTSLKTALNRYNNTDISNMFEATGARLIHKSYMSNGDIILSKLLDGDSLPMLSLALPGGKILVSTMETGVQIGKSACIDAESEVWRYE